MGSHDEGQQMAEVSVYSMVDMMVFIRRVWWCLILQHRSDSDHLTFQLANKHEDFGSQWPNQFTRYPWTAPLWGWNTARHWSVLQSVSIAHEVDIDFKQSNHEGELIEIIHKTDADGLVNLQVLHIPQHWEMHCLHDSLLPKFIWQYLCTRIISTSHAVTLPLVKSWVLGRRAMNSYLPLSVRCHPNGNNFNPKSAMHKTRVAMSLDVQKLEQDAMKVFSVAVTKMHSIYICGSSSMIPDQGAYRPLLSCIPTNKNKQAERRWSCWVLVKDGQHRRFSAIKSFSLADERSRNVCQLAECQAKSGMKMMRLTIMAKP